MSEAQVISLADRRPLIRLAADSEAAARTQDILDRVSANQEAVRVWEASPRGRFVNACSKLVSLGYEHTADRAISHYQRGFKLLDRVPCPASLGAAFGELASIPPSDFAASQQARLALGALTAIAFPFNETPQGAA